MERYGYFPVRESVDGRPMSRHWDVRVYRIGPRGGIKGYEGLCRVEELTKLYGGDNVIRIPAGFWERGCWVGNMIDNFINNKDNRYVEERESG